MRKNHWSLYWCSSECHCEDWFVVARTWRQARRFFADYEGMEPDEVEVDRLLALPEGVDVPAPDWADGRTLTECGAKLLREESPRSVELRGIVYEEGPADHILARGADDAFEARGQGRPNGTIRPESN